MMCASYAIGIDVGGTNTDAVLMEFPSKKIISSVKTTTTEDFTTGIMQAIQKVLVSQTVVTENHISSLMIGTTTFINAIVQRSSELSKVEIIRLCGPTSRSYPPFITFPSDLAKIIKSSVHFIDGGYEYDKQEVTKLDVNKLREIGQDLVSKYSQSNEILSIVIIGIFSPVYNDQEIQSKQILETIFKEMNFYNYSLTLSHEISKIGLLEREGASVLNASLVGLAKKTIHSLKENLKNLFLPNCQNDIFLTQNNGTLMTCEEAIAHPIFTTNSGPSNSLRGSASLTELRDAIVIDIGGTTSDVAVLKNGFPRPASSFVEIGGVRTNFFLADTISIGLGGGSIVQFGTNGKCSIGPSSVGYKLMKEAQAFGGKFLTTTDIAIAAGVLTLPGANTSLIKVTPDQIKLAQETMVEMLSTVIDKMKTSSIDIPVVLVGGGSSLFSDSIKISGVSNIIKPKHFSVANAIGAAITQVSATIEDIIDLGTPKGEEILREFNQRSIEQAVAKGAIRESIEVFTEKVHLAYDATNRFRVTCRAVGDLDTSLFSQNMVGLDLPSKIEQVIIPTENILPFTEKLEVPAEEFSFKFLPPTIVERDGRKEWILNEEDVEYMALGAAILGAGGGGSPYASKIELIRSIQSGKKVRVISVDDMKDEEFLYYVAYYGAPLMMIERLGGSHKVARAFETMRGLYKEKPLAGIASIEIGGLNSLVPLFVGAELDIPVIDCDFMGRAFPQFQMTTLAIYDQTLGPCCLSDEKGNQTIVYSVQDNSAKLIETRLRKLVMDFGCDAGLCGPPISTKEVKQFGIRNSLTRVWNLGRTLLQARAAKLDPLKVLQETENASLVFEGKIVDVLRVTEGGYNKGKITIQALGENSHQSLLVDFQNENLIARQYETNAVKDENGIPKEYKILAIVPDLITLCNTEDYSPILTEDLCYGLRVSVITLPANELLTNEHALKIVGPRAFGYDFDFVPSANYVEPKSIHEFL